MKGKTIRCKQMDVDRYQRSVAVCYDENKDLNAAMVRSGNALAYRKYSSDYIEAEQEAHQAHRGVWAGSFENPWEYRQDYRYAEQKSNIQNNINNCKIKGNINAQGKKLYHTPSGSSYDEVMINEKKGEKWFCSEKEAQEAGWKKAN